MASFLLRLILVLVLVGSSGCKSSRDLDADDFARMIKSGEIAAGKPLPEPRSGKYAWGWEEAASVDGSEGDRFYTCIAKDRRKVITIYTHNAIAFAACTVEEERHDVLPHTAPPTIVWHFFDADLMKRHVEACQEKRRKFEEAWREYRRYHGREETPAP